MFSAFTKSITDFVSENIAEDTPNPVQSLPRPNQNVPRTTARESAPASANVSRHSSPGNTLRGPNQNLPTQTFPTSGVGGHSLPGSRNQRPSASAGVSRAQSRDPSPSLNPDGRSQPGVKGQPVEQFSGSPWSTQEKLLIDHLGLNSKELEGMTKYELVQIAAVHAEMQQQEKGVVDLGGGPCIESMLLSQIVDIPGLAQSDLMHLSPKEIAKIAAVNNQSVQNPEPKPAAKNERKPPPGLSQNSSASKPTSNRPPAEPGPPQKTTKIDEKSSRFDATGLLKKTSDISKSLTGMEKPSTAILQGKMNNLISTGLDNVQKVPISKAVQSVVPKSSVSAATVWDSLTKDEKRKLGTMGLDQTAVNGLSKTEVEQILSVMLESENPNSTGSRNPSRETSRASSPTRNDRVTGATRDPAVERSLTEVSNQVSQFFGGSGDANQANQRSPAAGVEKGDSKDAKRAPVQRVMSQEQQVAEQRRLENERRLAEQQRILEEEIRLEEERQRAEEEKRLAEQKRRRQMQEKIEAERRRLEQERIEEEERFRREEEERIRREAEEERKRREEEERLRREEEERKRREEEERIRREEEERIRREEERLRREEEERIRREEEERIRREEEDRIQREEEERIRREEEERIRREEEERIRREEEERIRREEDERIRREEEERIRREEEERIRREEEERIRREEEERLQREEEERIRKEEERIRREEEARIRREEEEERRRRDEEERFRREEDEWRRHDEKQRMRREDDELIRRRDQNRQRRHREDEDERFRREEEQFMREERHRNDQRAYPSDTLTKQPQGSSQYGNQSYPQGYSKDNRGNYSDEFSLYGNERTQWTEDKGYSANYRLHQEQENRRNKYGDIDIYFSDEDMESDYSVEEAARGRQYQVTNKKPSQDSPRSPNEHRRTSFESSQNKVKAPGSSEEKKVPRALPPGLTEADVAGLSPEELEMIMSVMARADEEIEPIETVPQPSIPNSSTPSTFPAHSTRSAQISGSSSGKVSGLGSGSGVTGVESSQYPKSDLIFNGRESETGSQAFNIANNATSATEIKHTVPQFADESVDSMGKRGKIQDSSSESANGRLNMNIQSVTEPGKQEEFSPNQLRAMAEKERQQFYTTTKEAVSAIPVSQVNASSMHNTFFSGASSSSVSTGNVTIPRNVDTSTVKATAIVQHQYDNNFHYKEDSGAFVAQAHQHHGINNIKNSNSTTAYSSAQNIPPSTSLYNGQGGQTSQGDQFGERSWDKQYAISSAGSQQYNPNQTAVKFSQDPPFTDEPNSNYTSNAPISVYEGGLTGFINPQRSVSSDSYSASFEAQPKNTSFPQLRISQSSNNASLSSSKQTSQNVPNSQSTNQTLTTDNSITDYNSPGVSYELEEESYYANLPYQQVTAPLAISDISDDQFYLDQEHYFPYVDEPQNRLQPSNRQPTSRDVSPSSLKSSDNPNLNTQNSESMNSQLLLKRGEETAANFGKMFEMANSALSNFAEDFSKGMNYGIGDPQNFQQQTQNQSAQNQLESRNVAGDICVQCNETRLERSSDQSNGHFCAKCNTFVCLQCCKLVTNQNTRRKEWLCLFCHKGQPREADLAKQKVKETSSTLEASISGQVSFSQQSGSFTSGSFQDQEPKPFDQKSSAANLSSFFLDGDYINFEKSQKELRKQSSTESTDSGRGAVNNEQNQINTSLADISSGASNLSNNQSYSNSAAFDDFDPNQYLAQLDVNWNSDPVQTISDPSQKSNEHTITWSSSSSWKPKQNELQETSLDGSESLEVKTTANPDTSTTKQKLPSRIMPPLPKDIQRKSNNFEELGQSQSSGAANLTYTDSYAKHDWSTKSVDSNQSQPSVLYSEQSDATQSYYDYGGYDDSQYYDYESYNSGYYDQYGNWVQQLAPMYQKHALTDAQNDYENIVEKRNVNSASENSSSNSKMFDHSGFDIPSGVITERTESNDKSTTSMLSNEPIYENSEIMYPMVHDGNESYLQETMDMINYQDHYSSGEEESSDVELIEEGSMGRYSTFSNLSTAKEKKSKDSNYDSNSTDASGDQNMQVEEELLDPDSNNFVQYQQEQEISAALAKAGRHPRTPLCTLIESSEEDELTDYGMGRSKKKVLDIPKRPTRSEMLQKLEELQAGIEQKSSTLPNPKLKENRGSKNSGQSHQNQYHTVPHQTRVNQIITIEAPKSSASSGVGSRGVQTSTQTMPKSALKTPLTTSNISASKRGAPSIPPPPPPVTTSGQTSLYYRLAKDMISEHYNVGKSSHSQSLASRLEIGQTPMEPTSTGSVKLSDYKKGQRSAAADTSDLNLSNSKDYIRRSNDQQCTISTQTGIEPTSHESGSVSRTTETQCVGTDLGSPSSNQAVVKEKRVKFLEKRTWSLPETEEDSEVGCRSLAVNVDRVLINSPAGDLDSTKGSRVDASSGRDSSDSVLSPTRVNVTSTDNKPKRGAVKRVLPQPDPEEVEREENSNRFGGTRIKARPLRNDEVDILRKRLLAPSSKDKKYSSTNYSSPSSSSPSSQAPLQSILKKDSLSSRNLGGESKGRRMTSTSVQADGIGDFESSLMKELRVESGGLRKPWELEDEVIFSSLGNGGSGASSSTRSKSESRYDQSRYDAEARSKRKLSGDPADTEDGLLRQLKSKISYLENCKRENFEIHTGMACSSMISGNPPPRETKIHTRLGSPRRSPDPSFSKSHQIGFSSSTSSSGSHLSVPGSKNARSWSPRVATSDLVVHIEEPNPIVYQQKKKVHQELKYLVDDLQRRQLTEARRALTSITTQKTTDLEKYAYPKGRGLVWVASQAVKPKIVSDIFSPATQIQPQAPIIAPSPVPSIEAQYRMQAQPDQVIVTPGFATGATFIPATPPALMLSNAPLAPLPNYAPAAVGDLILPAGLVASNALFPSANRLYFDPNPTSAYVSTRDRLLLSPGQNYTMGRNFDAEFDSLRRNRMNENHGFVPGIYNPNQAQNDLQSSVLMNPIYQNGLFVSQTDPTLARYQQPGMFESNDVFGMRNLTPQDPATIKRDSKLELIASLQQQLDDLYRVELYRSAVDATSVGQTQQPSISGNLGLSANASINELKKSIDQRWQQLDQSSTLLRNLSANRLAQTLGSAGTQSSSAMTLNPQSGMVDQMGNVITGASLASLYDPYPVRDSNVLPNVIVEEINDTGSIISSPTQMNALVTSPTYSTAFNQLQSTIEPIIQQSAQTQQMQAQIFQQQQQLAQTQQQLNVLQQQTQQIQQTQVPGQVPVQVQDAQGNVFNQVVPTNQFAVQLQPPPLFEGMQNKNPANLALTPLQQHQQQAFSLSKKDAPDFGNSYNSKTQTLPTKSSTGVTQSGLIRPLEHQQQMNQSLINSMNNNPYATLSRAAVNEYSSHPQFYDNQVFNVAAGSNQRTSGHFGGVPDTQFAGFADNHFFSGGAHDKAIRSMTDLSRSNQPPDLLERALIKPSQLSIEDLHDGRFKRQVDMFGQDGSANNRGNFLQEFPTRDPGSINFSQLPLKSFRLSQDPKDRSGRSNGLGLSIVGGKIIPETSNTKVAMIQKIFPGKVAEVLNPQLQEGDIVIEWNGNSLVGKTYEEVQHIIQSKTTGDVDILVCPQAQAKSIMSKADRTAQMSVYSSANQNPRIRKDHDFHNMQFIKGQYQVQQSGPQWVNQSQLNPQDRHNLSASYNQDLNRSRLIQARQDDPIQYGNQGSKAWRAAGIYSTLPRGKNNMDIGRSKPQQKGLWLDQDSGILGPPTSQGSQLARNFDSGFGHQFNTLPVTHSERYARSGNDSSQWREHSQGAHLDHYGEDFPPLGGYSKRNPGVDQSRDRVDVCAEEEIRGEMQIAVAYSDETQELVVDIIQAKGLSPPASKLAADPFVKVYLLPDRCPENKRRIRYTRGTLNPFWNQSIEYGFLPRNHLPRKYLELTVWDYDKQRTNTFLGEVIVDLGDYTVLDGRARWYLLTEHTDSPDAYLDRVHLMQEQIRDRDQMGNQVRKARSQSDLENNRFGRLSGDFDPRSRGSNMKIEASYANNDLIRRTHWDSDPEMSASEGYGARRTTGTSYRTRARSLEKQLDRGSRQFYHNDRRNQNSMVDSNLNELEHDSICRMTSALANTFLNEQITM